MKNNSKFRITKGSDQLITFEHKNVTIAWIKVHPGNDPITFKVNPAISKKWLPAPVVKLYGSCIIFNPLIVKSSNTCRYGNK